MERYLYMKYRSRISQEIEQRKRQERERQENEQREIRQRLLKYTTTIGWFCAAGESKTHYWTGSKTLCDRWLVGWRWEVIWRKKTDEKCESCLAKTRLLFQSFRKDDSMHRIRGKD